MTVEFSFHGATAPTGLASTHTLEALPQRGDRFSFTDGSQWGVTEVNFDVRETATAIVIQLGPFADRGAR